MSKTKLRKEYEARFGVVEGGFRLYDAKGNMIYYENSYGYWEKREYDSKGNMIYYGGKRMSKSKLRKEYEARFGAVDDMLRLYTAKGNEIYREYSDGYWVKQEYDAEGNKIYREDGRDGVTLDNRPCSDKVFIDEQTGKKFKMTEVKK